MNRAQRQIDVEHHGDVVCVRLRKRKMEEDDLHQLSAEISRLIQKDGCRKLVLNFGPEGPLCLYSIFLAKLVSIQRKLHEAGGALRLAQVAPEIMKIFEACKLQTLFEFCPDQETAITELSAGASQSS